jgi:hypothetical protein
MTADERPDPATTVDLEAYPIADTAEPGYGALVARCRGDLEARQYCVLPGFVTPEALAAMLEEAAGLVGQAYANASQRNCYLQRARDPALPADHPRNIFFDASYRMIANDLFAETSLLTGLYRWPPVGRLIADIVGAETLFPNEDPYQPVNVLCYGAGDRSAWHFDSTNAFTVTLMLQAAEAGGEFEIAPNTRSETDPSVDALREVLLGERARVVTVPREPGALVVFRGCNSVHRVTPVEGTTRRLMAVFVYETEPGVTGDPEVNETVYGPRTAAG